MEGGGSPFEEEMGAAVFQCQAHRGAVGLVALRWSIKKDWTHR